MRSKNQLYGLFAQLKCCFFLIGSEGKYVVIVTCISGDPFPHIKITQQQHLKCNIFIFWRDLGSSAWLGKHRSVKDPTCSAWYHMKLLPGHETTDTTQQQQQQKLWSHKTPTIYLYIYIYRWSPLMPIIQVPIFSSKFKVTLVNEAHFLSLTIVL